jgi:anti-sigma-K factor RskA
MNRTDSNGDGTMSTDHQELRDLLPGYALGALDLDELRAVEDHLTTCVSCQQTLAQYREISGGMLMATPPVAPPTRLRQGLQQRLAAGRAPRAPAQPVRRNWGQIGQWALGLAAVALIALNVLTYLQLRALQEQQTTLAQQLNVSQTALALISQPGSRAVQVKGETGGGGSFIVGQTPTTGVLFAQGLAELEPSQTYQIWLIDPEGNPVSVGLFRLEPGQSYVTILILSERPITDFAGLGVTIEPFGGVPSPTGPLVLSSDL